MNRIELLAFEQRQIHPGILPEEFPEQLQSSCISDFGIYPSTDPFSAITPKQLSQSTFTSPGLWRLVSSILGLQKKPTENLWHSALESIQQNSSSPPFILLQKIADIYTSLSRQSSLHFHLENFWPLSQELTTRIEKAPNSSWNTKSVNAVLSLVDYICAHHSHAEKLLLPLTQNASYTDSTLSAFLRHLQIKHDEICVYQFNANQQSQQLVEKLLTQDLDAKRADNLRDLFLGGTLQPIPVGLLRYVEQYTRFLQSIIHHSAAYPDQVQAHRFTADFRSQAIRFSTLHAALFQTCTRITSTLSSLQEWPSSKKVSLVSAKGP